MASILRSSKFVRYIAGFARNVVLNTPREFDGNFVNTTQCLCGAIPRTFASQSSVQYEQNLEKSLKRIDQDVRKSGRISRRDIEDVLEEIRNTRTATSSQSLLVIRCCGNLVPDELPEVRTKLVQEIWNTLNKLNVPMDISHYNALLRVYLENEHPFSPTEFLSELEDKGIEPNRVTYQRLIARYCQDGDIEGATKVLEFMREKQLPVNENVFNALIMGHSQTGDMDSAHGILAVMAQAGLEPSADTYTTLLCGYAKNGNIETILQLCDECESKEVFLLDKDYLDIVYALATNGHSEHVPQILTKVRKALGYKQDAFNLILRLVNKGQEEAAYEVLKSMPRNTKEDGSPLPSGQFFIKQLVKANRPIEKIIEYCNKCKEDDLLDRPLLLATETSLQLGNDKIAYRLLEELQMKGHEIRQHYFWPLILAKANDTTGKGIIEVLNKMQSFNIVPNQETLREYVLPNLKGNSTEILSILRDSNVSLGTSACSLVIALLQKNEIEEAAAIATRISAYYHPELIKRPLTKSFYKTKDVTSYISIIRVIYENLERRQLVTPNEENTTLDRTEVVGNLILDLTMNPREFVEHIPAILKMLVEQGLSISSVIASKIEDRLGEKMTEEVSQLLGKLTSGDLTPVPFEQKPPSYTPSNQMNIPQLERLIHNLQAKGQEVKGLKRQLLTLYYRAKDLEKTENLLKELAQSEFVWTSGIYAQLMDLYAYHDNIEKALEYFEKLKQLEGDKLEMDEIKIVRMAHLFIKNDKFDEAIKFIETVPRDKSAEERPFTYSANVWRVLNLLAEQGREEDLNKLFDTLLKYGFIDINNGVLGPLIKVLIVKNDLKRALEKFEWCVRQHKATPWKNELACQLIQAEDAENLQRLTDLSTLVHGEINSLYDLVFAFVECGRIRQARKILETPGLQNRPNRINYACERYQQEGSVKSLEGLKDATRDLNHIDRSDIYYQLLLTYIKQQEPEKALGLWTQMQEEDLPPSDQFLAKLGTYLQECGMNVPFAIPQLEPQKSPVEEMPAVRYASQNIKQKLKAGDVDGVLKLKKQTNEKLSVTDQSLLIEKLVQLDRVDEANALCNELIDRGNLPVNRVFRFFLNRLATNGDVESLSVIGNKISHEMKKIVSFDNRFCHANLVAGQGEKYLSKLEQAIDEVTEENLNDVADQFPRGGAYGILERHPEFIEKYERVAIKYGEKGLVAPLNVLWTHYFINHNDAKAEEIWDKYLKNSPRIMFQKIVQTAREKQDEELIKKLIDHLKISNVTEGAIGNAYSCLLDILVPKGKKEEVVSVLEEALKQVKIDYINRTALLRVKTVYDEIGKPFDYVIPPKVNQKGQTSSSSDDDAVRK